MGYINEISTQDALNTSKSPFWVHKGTFDRISKILQNGKIQTGAFASFTDGMPLLPIQGDSVIVFDKQKLIDRGYHFLKIKYTKEFLARYPEIFEYVLEYRSEDEIKNFLKKEMDIQIENCRSYINEYSTGRESSFSLLRKREDAKNEMLKDPMGYFIKIISYENEIIAKGPVEFNEDDVLKIVYSSEIFERYYPAPRIYQDKIIYAEDYFPPTCVTFSPLYIWMEDRMHDPKLKKVIMASKDMVSLYQYINAILLNPDWIIYVRLNFKPLINLPQKWDEVFKRMHLLKNDERKLEIIDYVFRRYRLRYIKNDDYERQLLKQLEGSKTVL